ncbi:hypothetical protein ADUPG1_009826, partial [Aduncisulcus paluster]
SKTCGCSSVVPPSSSSSALALPSCSSPEALIHWSFTPPTRVTFKHVWEYLPSLREIEEKRERRREYREMKRRKEAWEKHQSGSCDSSHCSYCFHSLANPSVAPPNTISYIEERCICRVTSGDADVCGCCNFNQNISPIYSVLFFKLLVPETNTVTRGLIINIPRDSSGAKPYGFIKSEEGHFFFFHHSQCLQPEDVLNFNISSASSTDTDDQMIIHKEGLRSSVPSSLQSAVASIRSSSSAVSSPSDIGVVPTSSRLSPSSFSGKNSFSPTQSHSSSFAMIPHSSSDTSYPSSMLSDPDTSLFNLKKIQSMNSSACTVAAASITAATLPPNPSDLEFKIAALNSLQAAALASFTSRYCPIPTSCECVDCSCTYIPSYSSSPFDVGDWVEFTSHVSLSYNGSSKPQCKNVRRLGRTRLVCGRVQERDGNVLVMSVARAFPLYRCGGVIRALYDKIKEEVESLREVSVHSTHVASVSSSQFPTTHDDSAMINHISESMLQAPDAQPISHHSSSPSYDDSENGDQIQLGSSDRGVLDVNHLSRVYRETNNKRARARNKEILRLLNLGLLKRPMYHSSSARGCDIVLLSSIPPSVTHPRAGLFTIKPSVGVLGVKGMPVRAFLVGNADKQGARQVPCGYYALDLPIRGTVDRAMCSDDFIDSLISVVSSQDQWKERIDEMLKEQRSQRYSQTHKDFLARSLFLPRLFGTFSLSEQSQRLYDEIKHLANTVCECDLSCGGLMGLLDGQKKKHLAGIDAQDDASSPSQFLRLDSTEESNPTTVYKVSETGQLIPSTLKMTPKDGPSDSLLCLSIPQCVIGETIEGEEGEDEGFQMLGVCGSGDISGGQDKKGRSGRSGDQKDIDQAFSAFTMPNTDDVDTSGPSHAQGGRRRAHSMRERTRGERMLASASSVSVDVVKPEDIRPDTTTRKRSKSGYDQSVSYTSGSSDKDTDLKLPDPSSLVNSSTYSAVHSQSLSVLTFLSPLSFISPAGFCVNEAMAVCGMWSDTLEIQGGQRLQLDVSPSYSSERYKDISSLVHSVCVKCGYTMHRNDQRCAKCGLKIDTGYVSTSIYARSDCSSSSLYRSSEESGVFSDHDRSTICEEEFTFPPLFPPPQTTTAFSPPVVPTPAFSTYMHVALPSFTTFYHDLEHVQRGHIQYKPTYLAPRDVCSPGSGGGITCGGLHTVSEVNVDNMSAAPNNMSADLLIEHEFTKEEAKPSSIDEEEEEIDTAGTDGKDISIIEDDIVVDSKMSTQPDTTQDHSKRSDSGSKEKKKKKKKKRQRDADASPPAQCTHSELSTSIEDDRQLMIEGDRERDLIEQSGSLVQKRIEKRERRKRKSEKLAEAGIKYENTILNRHNPFANFHASSSSLLSLPSSTFFNSCNLPSNSPFSITPASFSASTLLFSAHRWVWTNIGTTNNPQGSDGSMLMPGINNPHPVNPDADVGSTMNGDSMSIPMTSIDIVMSEAALRPSLGLHTVCGIVGRLERCVMGVGENVVIEKLNQQDECIREVDAHVMKLVREYVDKKKGSDSSSPPSLNKLYSLFRRNKDKLMLKRSSRHLFLPLVPVSLKRVKYVQSALRVGVWECIGDAVVDEREGWKYQWNGYGGIVESPDEKEHSETKRARKKIKMTPKSSHIPRPAPKSDHVEDESLAGLLQEVKSEESNKESQSTPSSSSQLGNGTKSQESALSKSGSTLKLPDPSICDPYLIPPPLPLFPSNRLVGVVRYHIPSLNIAFIVWCDEEERELGDPHSSPLSPPMHCDRTVLWPNVYGCLGIRGGGGVFSSLGEVRRDMGGRPRSDKELEELEGSLVDHLSELKESAGTNKKKFEDIGSCILSQTYDCLHSPVSKSSSFAGSSSTTPLLSPFQPPTNTVETGDG